MRQSKNLRILGIMVLLVTWAGCAPGPKYYLSEPARDNLGSTDLILGVEQREINADIAGSNITTATGGGLIPALIDAHIEKGQAKKADKRIAPIRDALIDYDFPAVFEQSLKESLGKLDWLHLNTSTLSRESGNEWISEYYSNSEADAVLYIIATYQFTPKFKELSVNCEVYMLPKAEALLEFREKPKKKKPLAKSNNIYRNDELNFTKPLDTKAKNEEAVELWAENNGKRVRDALNEAASELAGKLAEDICNTRKK